MSPERLPLLALAAGMAAGAAIVLYLGRGTAYTPDEMAWVIAAPDLDLRDAFTPHNGHLLLSTKLIYKAVLEVFGSGYLAFRLLTLALVLLTTGLVYLYARRRIGPWAALAPSLVLLVFGSDPTHVILGNGITILLALASGLGALIAFERHDRAGDVAAALLLLLGCATYTIALPFVVGVAVLALLGEDRWRRVWVPAVPLALYVVWWIWSLGTSSDAEGQLVYSNVLTLPSWSIQALGSGLSALAGLNYNFGGDAPTFSGPVAIPLALAAIAWFAWRAWPRPHPSLLAAVGIALTLWAIQAVARTVLGTPDVPRYMYPTALAVVLLGTEAARGLRWTRAALAALFTVAVVGVMTNVALLRDSGASWRAGPANDLRAELAGLEIAGAAADPAFDPYVPLGGQNQLVLAFAVARVLRDPPVPAYREVVEEYGEIGYSPEDLAGLGDATRVRTDAVLAEALGLGLTRAGRPGGSGCTRLTAPAQGGIAFPVPSTGVTVVASPGVPVPLGVHRFAALKTIPAGTVPPGSASVLGFQRGDGPGGWRAATSAPELTICPAP